LSSIRAAVGAKRSGHPQPCQHSGVFCKSTDGKGQVTHYDYDDNDRLIQVDKGVNCATNCVTYTYDTRGNLIKREDVVVPVGVLSRSFAPKPPPIRE